MLHAEHSTLERIRVLPGRNQDVRHASATCASHQFILKERRNQMQLAATEEWVLISVLALQDEAYGVSIHDQLTAAGARTSLGAIYTNLDRLEHKGFVSSRLGGASPSRGGRRKRLFRITALGRRALVATQTTRERLLALRLRTT